MRTNDGKADGGIKREMERGGDREREGERDARRISERERLLESDSGTEINVFCVHSETFIYVHVNTVIKSDYSFRLVLCYMSKCIKFLGESP